MLNSTLTFGATVFIMGIGTLVLMASAAAIGFGTRQLEPKERNIQWYIFAIIAIWYGVAIAVSMANLLSIPLLAPFALFPIVLGTLLSFYAPIKKLLHAIPTHWLVFIQTYRTAGVVFLYPYMTEGVIERGFALNAGIGDVLTGLLALPVGLMLMRNMRGSTVAFIFWTIFGIGDLLVAPASAIYFGGQGLGNFPISFVPLFLGPPFGILIHIITLRNFWLWREKIVVSPQMAAANA